MAVHRKIALALAIACAPAPALARGHAPAKPSHGKLAAVNLFSPMSLLGIAGLLTQRALAAARHDGFAVASADSTEAKLGNEAMKKLRACELKPDCLAANAAALDGGLLLAGTLDRDEVHYNVQLVLVDLASGKPVASAERQVLIASRELDAQFDAMLPDLLAGKSSAPTRLVLSSPQKHVRVMVDDRPLGELPVTLELSPGRHEVKAEKPNYLSSDRFVELAPGTTNKIEIPLTLIPNRVDPDEAVAASTVHQAASGAAPEIERHGGVPLASWISFGAAVAAAGAGTYFALTEHGIANRAVPGTNGVLDITRSEALAGRRDATVANICFGVAGAAALIGAVVWIVDAAGSPEPVKSPSGEASRTETQVSFAPVVLRGGGEARFTVGF